jgi:hypothetical protein
MSRRHGISWAMTKAQVQLVGCQALILDDDRQGRPIK